MTLVADTYVVAPGTTTVRGGFNGPDVVAPSWGAAVVNVSGITQTSYTVSASQLATDAQGVTVYLYQIGSGPLTVIAGSVPTTTITGRTPGATETVSLYARDAAGNTSPPISTSVTLAASAGPLPAQIFRTDAVRTWFTKPEDIQVNGYVYTGWTNKTGGIGVSRIDVTTGAAQHFVLATLPEVDDHNNASVMALSGGRIAAFYGTHNDGEFKYRVWNGTGAFDSAGSWTAQANRGASEGPYSYPKPFIFPGDNIAGRVWLFHRRWVDGGGSTRSMAFRNTATFTGTSDPWSAYVDVLLETGARPYVVTCQDGNFLHCAISSAHPNEATFTTIRHFKAEMDDGGLLWTASDDTPLSLPFGVSSTTRADDGGDVKRWVSDVIVAGDGQPRILWMKYPNNNGTAIEYWHSRWTGSAWVAHKITDDGAGLYPGEQYYHGGLVFDAVNASRIYLSAPISGVRQIQEWRTADSGATWAQHRVLTSGGSAGNPLKFRPTSPRNHTGQLAVMWNQGRYTTYIDFDTALHGAG